MLKMFFEFLVVSAIVAIIFTSLFGFMGLCVTIAFLPLIAYICGEWPRKGL